MINKYNVLCRAYCKYLFDLLFYEKIDKMLKYSKKLLVFMNPTGAAGGGKTSIRGAAAPPYPPPGYATA